MSTMKPHLYINSKGYFVTRHSYSGSDSFRDCARKYYLERVQGWAEKVERSSTKFGIALEAAITFWHKRGQNTAAAVAEFVRLWAEYKDKPYTYSKSDLDWDRLNLTGQELVKLYAIRYPTFPYVVKNPLDSFQVETNFEVFPGVEKYAGIEFTSYIDLVAETKGKDDDLNWKDYTQCVPGAPVIIDMKTSGKDVPELTVLDPQLRSYSWVKGWSNVAFLWFRKMGRTISKGDSVTFLEAYAGFQEGADATVLAQDDFGLWITSDQFVLDGMAQFEGKSKAVEAARAKYVSENAKSVPERVITKQRVQFKLANITQESADDIGRKIKQDIVNIVSANTLDIWPMDSGVRYPHEKCPNCPMRGICSGNSELRDMLVARKQLDELDFGKESE